MVNLNQAGAAADFIAPELTELVAQRLGAIEILLNQTCKADIEFINEMTTHLLAAGGKRFRPLVTVLAATLGDPMRDEVVKAAVVIELTHLATLYHDDVMDEATLRRGTQSANSRFGNAAAILTGDFLFARASELVADLGPAAVKLQAQTFERLVTGQLLETVGPAAEVDPVEHHILVLAEKTGSLIATAAQFGAEFAGATANDIAAMRSFGEAVGVAFQLADDIIDLTSETSDSGKTPGTDLLEGVPTLTTLLVQRANLATDQELIEILSKPVAASELPKVLDQLRSHSALTEAKQVAHSWAQRAKDAVANISNPATKQTLVALCDAVIARSA
jgi:heptaprenyl diphosphate synthase